MLILAGVSIGSIIGENGLISKSKEARNEAIGMQEGTTTDRDKLYGELIGKKDSYEDDEEDEEVGVNLTLTKDEYARSITATAEATSNQSEIISYTFYIKKITEDDIAYVIMKKSDKLTNIATQSNLEKDIGYQVKVVAINKEGVSKTAEKKIALGDAVKISVVPISNTDSYPSTISVTATSVISNIDYIILPNGEKVEAQNGRFKLKTTYNSTKNGPIVFTAYDKDGNSSQLEYMEQNVANFETEWTIAEDNTEVIIPITGNVDVYIDYGDGNAENVMATGIPITGENYGQRHTFAQAGTYTVKISGNCTGFGSYLYYSGNNKKYYDMYSTNITGIKKWGCLNNSYYGFKNCTNMKGTIPSPKQKSFANINTFGETFQNCSELTGSIPVGMFDNCPNVTSFASTFNNCRNLTGNIPKRLFDNCPNITSIDSIFNECIGLTGKIPMKLFANKAKCTNVNNCFRGCAGLTGEIPEDLFLNTPNIQSTQYAFCGCGNIDSVAANLFTNINNGENNVITDMRGTFEGAGITAIPSGLFDKCTEVKIFGINGFGYAGVFQYCNKITSTIPPDLFKNCKKVTDMTNAFYGCSGITGSIPGGLFDNCRDVTSFKTAFTHCSSLTGNIPAGLFENCSNVTTFDMTFANCSNLTGSIPSDLFTNCSEVDSFRLTFAGCGITEIPSDLFAGCPNVTNFASTFDGCGKLTSIPAGLFDNCSEVTSFSSTFSNCRNLTGSIPADLFANCSNATNFGGTFWYCEKLTSIPAGLFANCSNATNFGATFQYCLGLTGNIPDDLFANCTNVTNFGGTFYSCGGLTGSIPENLFADCLNVISFDSTFRNCGKITSIPANLFANCPNVTNFASTFGGCGKLTSIPAGLFDNCPNVTSFNSTFSWCSGLASIPAGLFDNCPNITTFNGTFSNCWNLTEIPSGLFDKCTNVTDFGYSAETSNNGYREQGTFYGCGSLTGTAPELWNRTNVTESYYCFYNCTNLDNYEDIPTNWK